MQLDVCPDKACYRPGETVRLDVTLSGGAAGELWVVARIFFLADEVARLAQSVRPAAGAATAVAQSWTPPAAAPRGYGADLLVFDGDGRPLAAAATAFDVLHRWTQAPRYGFLTDFRPDRNDLAETMRWLLRYHVNGLQFYDWLYRHDQLLPPGDVFDDPLGRQLSLDTVARLIHAAHAHGIAALPYTAVYAASPPFFRQHPAWALHDAEGQPIPFGDDFLVIMNPAPGAPWREHLLAQFAQVLASTDFDGLHLDQYGDPKHGFDAHGRPVDLAQALPELIDAAQRLVRRYRGDDGAVIFNAVGNWPVETVAPSAQDAVYIEVWPPDVRYSDLHRLIVNGQQLGGGKPVILAVYLDPAWQHNVRLAEAVIFASGGFHIALGEPGGLLADPYFPKYGRIDDALAAILRRYYDLAVRYQNVLSQNSHDATADVAGRTVIEGPGSDAAWVIARRGDGYETLSLLNLPDAARAEWNQPLPQEPPPLAGLRLRYYTDRPVGRVWWASPDGESLSAQDLDWRAGHDARGAHVVVDLPPLVCWNLLAIVQTSQVSKTCEVSGRARQRQNRLRMPQTRLRMR